MATLSSWYAYEKEEAFIQYLFKKVRLPSEGLVVEIGGGAGIHGQILAKEFGTRYLFTDLSKNFVDSATKSGLPAMQMDGLAMTLADASAACVVLVATSTLLYGAETRHRQCRECIRILGENGVAIFVTARRDARYHFWDCDDVDCLRQLGFAITWLNWGIIPGRLWTSSNRAFFAVVESMISRTNLPARSILLARR